MAQDLARSLAIGCVLRVRNGEAMNVAALKRFLQARELRIDFYGRAVRGEQDEPSEGIKNALVHRVTITGQRADIVLIGRQEQCEGRPLADLPRQVTRRSKGEAHR